MKRQKQTELHYKKYLQIIENLELVKTEQDALIITWLEYLYLIHKFADKYYKYNNWLKVSTIILGLLIPLIEGTGINGPWCTASKGITVVGIFGVIIGVTSSLNGLFNNESKWYHYRKYAEIVRNEGEDFLSLAGQYQDLNSHKEAMSRFITIITNIKRQENSVYFESVAKSEKADKNLKDNTNSDK